MLEKPKAVAIEEVDGKGSLGFAFHGLTELGRIPLHVKLVVDVSASPHGSQMNFYVRKCTNRYLRPSLEGRQWRIGGLFQSFAEG
jgi:hypothetical protein